MAEEIKVVAVADPAKQVHKQRKRSVDSFAMCSRERNSREPSTDAASGQSL